MLDWGNCSSLQPRFDAGARSIARGFQNTPRATEEDSQRPRLPLGVEPALSSCPLRLRLSLETSELGWAHPDDGLLGSDGGLGLERLEPESCGAGIRP